MVQDDERDPIALILSKNQDAYFTITLVSLDELFSI